MPTSRCFSGATILGDGAVGADPRRRPPVGARPESARRASSLSKSGGRMTTTEADGRRMQVLMLGVGGEIFALDARQVREIIDPAPVTRVPGARPIYRRDQCARQCHPARRSAGALRHAAAPMHRRHAIVVLEIELAGDPTTSGSSPTRSTRSPSWTPPRCKRRRPSACIGSRNSSPPSESGRTNSSSCRT